MSAYSSTHQSCCCYLPAYRYQEFPMTALAFDQADLGQRLAALGDQQPDDADFGIIGFDDATVVRRYNRFESQAAGLPPHSVLGQPLFTSVAPCMNNYLVAQRFAD